METPLILDLLRKHGTEHTVSAMLSVDKTRRISEPLRAQEKILAKLIAMLEKKKLLRRGHIVEILSEGELSNEAEPR